MKIKAKILVLFRHTCFDMKINKVLTYRNWRRYMKKRKQDQRSCCASWFLLCFVASCTGTKIVQFLSFQATVLTLLVSFSARLWKEVEIMLRNAPGWKVTHATVREKTGIASGFRYFGIWFRIDFFYCVLYRVLFVVSNRVIFVIWGCI